MSTLEVNFEWENMSDTSMDSEDFENNDEFSDTQLKYLTNALIINAQKVEIPDKDSA